MIEQQRRLRRKLVLVYKPTEKFKRDGVAYFRIQGTIIEAEKMAKSVGDSMGLAKPFYVLTFQPARNRRISIRATMFDDGKLLESPIAIQADTDLHGRPRGLCLNDLKYRDCIAEGYLNTAKSGISLLLRRLQVMFDEEELAMHWMYFGVRDEELTVGKG